MNVRSPGRELYSACGLLTSGSGALYGGRSGKRVAYVRMEMSDRNDTGGLIVSERRAYELVNTEDVVKGSDFWGANSSTHAANRPREPLIAFDGCSIALNARRLVLRDHLHLTLTA